MRRTHDKNKKLVMIASILIVGLFLGTSISTAADFESARDAAAEEEAAAAEAVSESVSSDKEDVNSEKEETSTSEETVVEVSVEESASEEVSEELSSVESASEECSICSSLASISSSEESKYDTSEIASIIQSLKESLEDLSKVSSQLTDEDLQDIISVIPDNLKLSILKLVGKIEASSFLLEYDTINEKLSLQNFGKNDVKQIDDYLIMAIPTAMMISKTTGTTGVCDHCIQTMGKIGAHASQYAWDNLNKKLEYEGKPWYAGASGDIASWFLEGAMEGRELYGQIFNVGENGINFGNVLDKVTRYIDNYFVVEPETKGGEFIQDLMELFGGCIRTLVEFCMDNLPCITNLPSSSSAASSSSSSTSTTTSTTTSVVLETGNTATGSLSL